MTHSFILDTNVFSERTRPRPEPQVQQWLDRQPRNSFYLSAITVGEIRRGIALLPLGQRRKRLEQWFEGELPLAGSDRVLPVTQAVADRWGLLSAARQRLGMSLGLADGLIAATALEHNLTLVTGIQETFCNF